MSTHGKRLARWAIARRLTALAFLVLLFLARFEPTSWLVGSTTGTTTLGVVPLVDPLAFLELTLASGEWMPRAALGAGLLVVAALVLGPVFCGWICPLGFLLDLGWSLRAKLGRGGEGLPSRSLPTALRYAFLAAVLGFALVAAFPAFGMLSPVHLVGRSVAFALDPLLAVLALLLLVELFFPRVWCRALCPLGAFYALVGRRAPLRVQVDSEHECRAGCGMCSVNCPMGVPVMAGYAAAGKPNVDDPGCTRCGACIDSCPRGLLKLGFHPRRTAVRPEVSGVAAGETSSAGSR